MEHKPILFLSNGHGEDGIAVALIRELGDLKIGFAPLPLVGLGENTLRKVSRYWNQGWFSPRGFTRLGSPALAGSWGGTTVPWCEVRSEPCGKCTRRSVWWYVLEMSIPCCLPVCL